jgi:glycyl-tRNA synthetase beta chain
VSLADKLDTLAGDFLVGLIPTGSADPYGLRRAAVGVLRILEKFSWTLSVEELLQKATAVQPADAATQETQKKLELFFRQRWSGLLEERGYKADEIEAVFLGVGVVGPHLARLEALHKIRNQKEFESLALVFKRAVNIRRQAEKTEPASSHQINSDLLKEDSEKKLFEVLRQVQKDVVRHVNAQSYHEALMSMVSLQQPLADFFNGVMVMAEDRALRANRLAIIEGLVLTFFTVADLSKIQNA